MALQKAQLKGLSEQKEYSLDNQKTSFLHELMRYVIIVAKFTVERLHETELLVYFHVLLTAYFYHF